MIEQLREAIRKSGEGLGRLARRAGVGRGELSRLVRGDARGLTLDVAEKLAAALGLALVARRAGKDDNG